MGGPTFELLPSPPTLPVVPCTADLTHSSILGRYSTPFPTATPLRLQYLTHITGGHTLLPLCHPIATIYLLTLLLFRRCSTLCDLDIPTCLPHSHLGDYIPLRAPHRVTHCGCCTRCYGHRVFVAGALRLPRSCPLIPHRRSATRGPLVPGPGLPIAIHYHLAVDCYYGRTCQYGFPERITVTRGTYYPLLPALVTTVCPDADVPLAICRTRLPAFGRYTTLPFCYGGFEPVYLPARRTCVGRCTLCRDSAIGLWVPPLF